MKIKLLPLLFCATGMAFGQATTNTMPMPDAKSPQNLNVQVGPPMLGIHWTRGFEPNARLANEAKTTRPRRSPNMTYHGGKIMPTALTQAIFWGMSCAHYHTTNIPPIQHCSPAFH